MHGAPGERPGHSLHLGGKKFDLGTATPSSSSTLTLRPDVEKKRLLLAPEDSSRRFQAKQRRAIGVRADARVLVEVESVLAIELGVARVAAVAQLLLVHTCVHKSVADDIGCPPGGFLPESIRAVVINDVQLGAY